MGVRSYNDRTNGNVPTFFVYSKLYELNHEGTITRTRASTYILF